MKKWLVLFCLPLSLFAFPFSDPSTGLNIEIPESFQYDEEGSCLRKDDSNWWYTFTAPDQAVLTIEIDAYSTEKTLPEFFHRRLTEQEDNDSMLFEGLEYKNLVIAGLECTKYKLRALAIENEHIEPLYLVDYLFVKGEFGFTISLIKKDEGVRTHQKLDEMMHSVLKSIEF